MIDITAGISTVIQDIQGKKNDMIGASTSQVAESGNTFSAIFDQMVNLVGDTDSLAAEAEAAEIEFSLGKADSTHEVTIAQQKALVSLQYTVAIKNALMDAYQEIMNIQI